MPQPSIPQAKNTLRRALRAMLDPELRPAEVNSIWTYFRSACAYCELPLTRSSREGHIDHLVSTAQGGTNHISNRVLSCGACNGDEKRERAWEEFLRAKSSDDSTFASRGARIHEWRARHSAGVAVPDEVLLQAVTNDVLKAVDQAVFRLRAARAQPNSRGVRARNAHQPLLRKLEREFTMTESELLFEAFCGARGICWFRVREAESKRPDYQLHTVTGDLIVEVKQIDPTPEERRLLAIPVEQWNPDYIYHWGIPGERVRKKISTAVPQLKALSQGTTPTLLVLYDSVKFWPELLDEYAVKVAMYGIEAIAISPVAAPEGGATILARWHGPRRRMTPAHNTSLSALAILSDAEGAITLSVYHNFFALNPLPLEAFSAAGVSHYRLMRSPSEGFPEWARVP